MADIIDDAQAYNELHQEVSLRNQQAKMLPETHPGFDGWHCVDCEEEIPAKRLGWGRVRCVGCQEFKERADRAMQRNGRLEEL
jgi:RNA polymerase-binding transcription factor DksA